jgi:hypothetical protein
MDLNYARSDIYQCCGSAKTWRMSAKKMHERARMFRRKLKHSMLSKSALSGEMWALILIFTEEHSANA